MIVFKYPFNAKQNFIKRLIGLPNETVLIKRGDIFIKEPGEQEFHIARKPDVKLKAMLQLVADTKYIATGLTESGGRCPGRPGVLTGLTCRSCGQLTITGTRLTRPETPQRDIWLRYHHIVPSAEDWQWIKDGDRPPMMEELKGDLITDFYAYNAFTSMERMFT